MGFLSRLFGQSRAVRRTSGHGRLLSLGCNRGCVLVVLGCACLSLSTRAETSFFEGNFADSDISTVIRTNGPASASSQQALTGGNPGAHRRITTSSGGSANDIVVIAEFLDFAVYDPSAEGDIVRITYDEDYKCSAADGCSGDGQAFGVALRQDGDIYLLSMSVFPVTGVTGDNFQSYTADLTSEDFALLNYPPLPGSVVDSTIHPDFSAAGQPIQFGYFRENRASGPRTGGIDNWSVRINPPFECSQLPPAAIGWWPAEGNADDLLGINHGTLRNGTTFASGEVGAAFELDGEGDAIVIPPSPTLDATTGPGAQLTMVAWVKPNTIDATVQGCGAGDMVFRKGKKTNAAGFSYNLQVRPPDGGGINRIFVFYCRDGATDCVLNSQRFQVVSDRTILNKSWHHVAAVIDTTTLDPKRNVRIFVDGRETSHTTNVGAPRSGILVQSNVGLGIGSSWSQNSCSFWGRIDEPQLFARPLSACEIRAMYEARAGGQCTGDVDGDGVADYEDNCPNDPNVTQENFDGDPAGDGCDCAPSDPSVFTPPSGIDGLVVDDDETWRWCAADNVSGSGTVYDALRGSVGEYPVGTGASEMCLAMGLDSPEMNDATPLAPDQGFWFLFRERNMCDTESWGFESDGDERQSFVCDP